MKRNYPAYRTVPSFAKLVDEIFKGDLNHFVGADNTNTVPKANVVENDDAFELYLAAPGFRKEDFSVRVEKNKLTIKGTATAKDYEGKVSRREFITQDFTRSFILPETVNTLEIEASYDHGILLLTLPKKEEAKTLPPRQIAIG